MAYGLDFRKRVIAYKNSGHTKQETCQVFGISRNTLYLWENRLEATGTLDIAPRKRNPRKLPLDQLEAYITAQPDLYRSKRGKKVIGKVSGRCFERVSIVAGQVDGRFVAPMIYKQSMTSQFFVTWFENHLLTALDRPHVIVMDTASFHPKKQLDQLCLAQGHYFLPLPPILLSSIQSKKHGQILKIEWLNG